MSEIAPETSSRELTDDEKARIEKNRLKAKSLRDAKVIPNHPYKKQELQQKLKGAVALTDKNLINQNGRQYVDSGGGFLIEKFTNPEGDEFKVGDEDDDLFRNLEIPTVEVPINFEECLECADKFGDSYLLNNFKHPVCDKCRDNEEKHALITRTEAKDQYLLKDCDIDKRQPPLLYISRKNPHNPRWGEMKLYLHLQIKERAMEVWGSEEAIEEQFELRVVKSEKMKLKKYTKQIKALRMNVRSSLYDKTTKANHQHEWVGPDVLVNEDEDLYSHTCACGYSETFEKM